MIRNLALGAGAILLAACTTTVINNSPSACPAETGTLTVGPLMPAGNGTITAFEGDIWTITLDKSSAAVTSAATEGASPWGTPGSRTCQLSVGTSQGERCEGLTIDCPSSDNGGMGDDLAATVDLVNNMATVTVGTANAGSYTYTAAVSR